MYTFQFFLKPYLALPLTLQGLAGGCIHEVKGDDLMIICSEWNDFRSVGFAWLEELLATPVMLDGRNMSERDTAKAAGLLYFGIGRGGAVKA